MDQETKPAFFSRKSNPNTKILVLSVLSMVLLFSDARYHYTSWLREQLSVALYPLQRLATLPSRWGARAATFFATQTALELENEQLKRQQLVTVQRLLRETTLDYRYQALRQTVGLWTEVRSPSMVTEVLYRAPDPFSRKLIVDKGRNSGVREGSPVIDVQGLIGQVTRVLPLVSEVTLLTDQGFPVPVEIQRTGQRTVVFGTGDETQLEIRHLPSGADIREEDLLVTSGIDGIYAAGVPVARLVNIERNSVSPFARVRATPISAVNNSRFYVVMMPISHPSWPAAEAAAMPGSSGR